MDVYFCVFPMNLNENSDIQEIHNRSMMSERLQEEQPS